jgi:tetratricopeptide (TPR) repeat protein
MKSFLILFLVVFSISINADEIKVNPDEIAQNTIELLKSAKTGTNLELLQKAQIELSPWLDCQSVPNSMLLARGLLRYKQQQIIQANQDISLYLERNPNDLTALIIQGAIFRQLGDYEKAQNVCSQTERNLSKVNSAICFANVLSRQGKIDLAYEQLRNAVMSAQQESPQAYQRLHLELVKLDQLIGTNPQENITKALSAPYRDNMLWIAYSDFLLEQGSYEQLLNEIPNDSNDIRLQVRRAMAAKKLGKTENLNVDIFTQAKAQHNLSLRTDEALFLFEIADNPQMALDLLLEVWKTRKEPFEAKLLLKIAPAANKSEIALEILNWMKMQGWMGEDLKTKAGF